MDETTRGTHFMTVHEIYKNNNNAKKIYQNISSICFIDPKFTIFCLNFLSKESKERKLIDYIIIKILTQIIMK